MGALLYYLAVLFTVPTPTNAAAWAITVLEDHQQHGRGVGAVHA
jgi:hypothetical protein